MHILLYSLLYVIKQLTIFINLNIWWKIVEKCFAIMLVVLLSESDYYVQSLVAQKTCPREVDSSSRIINCVHRRSRPISGLARVLLEETLSIMTDDGSFILSSFTDYKQCIRINLVYRRTRAFARLYTILNRILIIIIVIIINDNINNNRNKYIYVSSVIS